MQISARSVAAWGAGALAIANLGRIPLGALGPRNAPITLADVIAVLVWLLLLAGILSGRVRIVVDGVISAAAAFVAIACLSTALAFRRYGLGLDGGFEVVAYLVRWVLYFGWYPFVAWCLTENESRRAWRYVDIALFAICVFGIFQAFLIPEFGTRLADLGGTPAWEYQGRRLVSTLLDPNFAGIMAVLALLPLLARFMERQTDRAWLILVPATAIVLTASRSSVLALAVGIVVLALARGVRKELLRLLVVGALLIIPVLPAVISYGESLHKFSIDASAAQRLVTWRRAVALWTEHPLLGIGFNATRAAQEAHGWTSIGGADTGFDGGVLFIMVLTGVLGAALYVLILGRGVLSARRAWRDPGLPAQARAHASATAASVLAVVVHSFFSNSILLPFVLQVLWVRFGRVAHISAVRRRHLGVLAALPLAIIAASCDPCSGVAACTTDYRVRLQGAIADYATGAPVANAQIRVSLAGAAGPATKLVATDRAGLWDAEFAANCCDHFRATVVVDAPDQAPYVVSDFEVPTVHHGGEATLVGTWLNRPFVRYGVTLLYRQTTPLGGAHVTFEPTGGIPFTAVRMDALADPSGIYHMDLASDRVGSVVGTLTVEHPMLAQPWVLQGFTVPVDYHYMEPRVYGINVYDSPTLARTEPVLP